MKTTVTRSQFHQAFKSIRPDNFSHAGLDALFDYFSELEEDIGEELEFDIIAICCDFSEYDSYLQAKGDMCLEYDQDIEEFTTVIEFDSGIIIQSF